MLKFLNREKKEPQGLKEVLKYLEGMKKRVDDLAGEILALKEKSRYNFKKIGVVRFNPFSETGGDQSFSVALLDGDNNGVVITSYYSRESNRIYAKPILAGSSNYSLSDEEKKAIKQAVNSGLEREKRD